MPFFFVATTQVIGTLEEVHMPQNGINHPGITALAQAFALNPLLRVINLNDNTFTEKGAVAMAEVSPFQLDAVLFYVNSSYKS